MTTRTHTGEQLIGCLIPPSIPRRPPRPAPLATLPGAAAGSDRVLIDVARLDQSGRLSTRALVRALGWRAGQRLDITAARRSIVITASAASRHKLTARGEVSVPAPTRALTGIGRDESVLLAADATRGVLVVHPMAVVAALLANPHVLGGNDAG
jgi:hypothetical protein